MKAVRSLVLVCFLMSSTVVWADDARPPAPAPKDKCPVCGMFVAKYPDFLSAIRYRDGSWIYFDGAKDMFKYYFDIKPYHPNKTAADIQRITVTDYYSLAPTDARTATYVVGSDVYGPMGRELVPFADAKDAAAFVKDHGGRPPLRFGEVTLALARSLD